MQKSVAMFDIGCMYISRDFCDIEKQANPLL